MQIMSLADLNVSLGIPPPEISFLCVFLLAQRVFNFKDTSQMLFSIL